MSLSDLVPAILATTKERKPAMTETEYHMRWLNKGNNRERFNAYRRAWRAKKRGAA